MRLIDADAFTEFLKDAVKRQKYEDTKIDGLLTVADVIEAVISELDGTSLAGFKNAPTIEPEPHWIPCSERLPEKIEKDYWVCLDEDHHNWQCVCKWKRYPTRRGDIWAWHLSAAHVVAWMPLPEPYKEYE